MKKWNVEQIIAKLFQSKKINWIGYSDKPKQDKTIKKMKVEMNNHLNLVVIKIEWILVIEC